MVPSTAPLHRATRIRTGGGIMPHPEAIKAQQRINSLQIHRIWFHLLWAASRRVLMLSTEKTGQEVVAISLPWQGDSVHLGN